MLQTEMVMVQKNVCFLTFDIPLLGYSSIKFTLKALFFNSPMRYILSIDVISLNEAYSWFGLNYF